MSIAWVQVSCRVADVIRQSEHVKPIVGRSDLDGQFGDPEVYTEWGLAEHDEEQPLMREYRYPAHERNDPDRKPCEHYVVRGGKP